MSTTVLKTLRAKFASPLLQHIINEHYYNYLPYNIAMLFSDIYRIIGTNIADIYFYVRVAIISLVFTDTYLHSIRVIYDIIF